MWMDSLLYNGNFVYTYILKRITNVKLQFGNLLQRKCPKRLKSIIILFVLYLQTQTRNVKSDLFGIEFSLINSYSYSGGNCWLSTFSVHLVVEDLLLAQVYASNVETKTAGEIARALGVQNGERSAQKLLSFLNLVISSCINGVNREYCNYCKLYIAHCIVSDNIFCVVNSKLV